jgi:hypothetical protein
MSDPAFWRDLAARFLELPDRTRDFRATRDEGRWTLAGGAKTEEERERLRFLFEQLATRAAAAAGAAPARVAAWLDLLASETALRSSVLAAGNRDGKEIAREDILVERVAVSSSDLCTKLETRAFAVRLSQDSPVGSASALVRSRLVEGDPRNLLPETARARVTAAHLEADRIRAEAECEIELAEEDHSSKSAKIKRKRANLEAARHVLGVVQAEYQSIGLSSDDLRKCMREEIESAVNSLELTPSQGEVLRINVLLAKPPSDRNFKTEDVVRLTHNEPERGEPRSLAKNDGQVASLLQRLREESRMSVEDLARAIDADPRSVYRHLSGQSAPRLRYLGAYERVFSEALKRKVVIRQMSV